MVGGISSFLHNILIAVITLLLLLLLLLLAIIFRFSYFSYYCCLPFNIFYKVENGIYAD